MESDTLSLFTADPAANLLPCDGMAQYFGPVFSSAEAQRHQNALTETIEWKHDEIIMFGKRLTTTRKVAWYGDKQYLYTYSGITKQALLWTPELKELKALVEKLSGDTFNSCLLNLYHDGNEGMSWHSDDEKMIRKDSTIASVSFGAERKFSFKHKQTGETVSLNLENGSLLLMKGTCQTHWLHALPKTRKITTPRINLTFRTIVP